MSKLLTQTTLITTFAAFAFAQTPQSTTQNSTQTNPAQTNTNVTQTNAAAPTGGQSFRGVLMDASCAAIQSRSLQSTATGSSQSADATRNRTDGAASSTAVPGSSAQTQS